MSRAKSICDRVYAVGGSELSAPEDAYVYLVDAGSELVMIDAGVGYGMKRIEENIDLWAGSRPRSGTSSPPTAISITSGAYGPGRSSTAPKSSPTIWTGRESRAKMTSSLPPGCMAWPTSRSRWTT